MPRIRLAHWHDGHLPGDVIEVDPERLRGLQRDGRVAAVLPDVEAVTMADPGPPVEVASLDDPEPRDADAPKRSRKAP